jgi:hypothetical protein
MKAIYLGEQKKVGNFTLKTGDIVKVLNYNLSQKHSKCESDFWMPLFLEKKYLKILK